MPRRLWSARAERTGRKRLPQCALVAAGRRTEPRAFLGIAAGGLRLVVVAELESQVARCQKVEKGRVNLSVHLAGYVLGQRAGLIRIQVELHRCTGHVPGDVLA